MHNYVLKSNRNSIAKKKKCLFCCLVFYIRMHNLTENSKSNEKKNYTKKKFEKKNI